MSLPGKPNAWLLGSDPQVGTGNAEFVVGHLSPVGYFNDGRWTLSVGGILLAFLVLIAKITILLAIVYFESLDLDCPFVQPFSQFAGYIQAASSFALCFLGPELGLSRSAAAMPYLLETNGASG